MITVALLLTALGIGVILGMGALAAWLASRDWWWKR